MPTDKSINFSTKPICPECGREISTDEIDVEKDRAWCPNCHREMSFVEVADYSLVQAKRNEPLPPGFSIISDSEDSLVLSFKTARIGLRLLGLLFSISLAIPIPWVIYHMAAGIAVHTLLPACSSLYSWHWRFGSCCVCDTSGNCTWSSSSVLDIVPSQSYRLFSSRVSVNSL